MNSYYVKDIVPKGKSKAKYIFIFESPHTTEIETGIPVSGATGKYIYTKIGLSDKNFNNFGEYIKYKQNAAVLNVSNYPLQQINSEEQDDDECENRRFIRENYRYCGRHRDSSINRMEEKLINCLRKRLEEIYTCNNQAKMIVCGKFAETYFQKAMPNIRYYYMPHPSRKGWRNLSACQEELLKELKKELS